MSVPARREQSQGGIELLAQLEAAGAITDTGLTLPPGVPWDQYEALAVMLGQLHRTSAWLIGDLLNYGERVYGETYAQVIALTGLADQTCYNYASICKYVPKPRRRLQLPFSVHALVAYKEPEEQDLWLDRALENRWTRQQLHDAMRGNPVHDHGPMYEILPPEGDSQFNDAAELLRLLRSTLHEEACAEWLAEAIAKGMTMQQCLGHAQAMADGAYI